jgi:hypothetical protein
MKWKKDNNFKSLNDPQVKLEANATNHGQIYPHSTNDTSWSSISNAKKDQNHLYK